VDLQVMMGILLLVNGPGLGALARSGLMFLPDRVTAGEWWRLATYPLVHCSWLHVALDAAAFMGLMVEMRRRAWWRRWSRVAAASAGSLALTWWATPEVGDLGLCGLSGVAHGLMAASGMDLVRASRGWDATRWTGLFTLGLAAGKSVVEAITGQVLFAFLYFGLVGTPLVMCHLGGVLGGLLWSFAESPWRRQGD
jgi:rhomboid family GlyGly-CTERM serine protease